MPVSPSSAAPRNQPRVLSGPDCIIIALLAVILVYTSAALPQTSARTLRTTNEAEAIVADGETADDVRVQGRWAFTERRSAGGPAYMATTSAIEDAETWLILACQPGHQLAARLIHTDVFPFTLDTERSVALRSATLGDIAISVTPISSNQLVFDPQLLGRLLPQLLEEETIRVSMPGSDARPHEYAFATQPNDVALAQIRSGCLDPR